MKATNREKELLSNSIVDDRLEIVRLKADLDEAVGLLKCASPDLCYLPPPYPTSPDIQCMVCTFRSRLKKGSGS